MEKLVLHPTSTAQWHALVNEAQQMSQIVLSEDIESYLVFLLMRFAERPEMAQSIVALEFLQGLDQAGEQRHQQLRDLGDKCLLFSGLFPGLAEKRRVDQSYFVNMGQSAYSVLADGFEQMAELFARLSHYFQGLMDILKAMRRIGANDNQFDFTDDLLDFQDPNFHLGNLKIQ